MQTAKVFFLGVQMIDGCDSALIFQGHFGSNQSVFPAAFLQGMEDWSKLLRGLNSKSSPDLLT